MARLAVGTKLGWPLLGSNRTAAPAANYKHTLNIPVEMLNKTAYRSWVLNRGDIHQGSLSTTSGLVIGSGLQVAEAVSTNANAKITGSSNGGLIFTTGVTTDNMNASLIGPNIFKPATDKPILYACQARYDDISSVGSFFGLHTVTDHSATAALVVSTAALGDIDCIGFHFVGNLPTPALYVKDGATEDTVSTGLLLDDATDFGCALRIYTTHVDWFFEVDGVGKASGVLALTNNAPITDLASMHPNFALQNIGSDATVMTIWRAWCAQENDFSNQAGFVSDFGRV